MKAGVVVLNKKAVAKIPHRVAKDRSLKGLSPLALKILLNIIYRWNQRERVIAHIPPHRRELEHLEFNVPWRELKMSITPTNRPSFGDRDYRNFRSASEELFNLQVRRERAPKGTVGYYSYHFVDAIEYDAATNVLTYTLSSKFKFVMRLAEGSGFTLVPLADAYCLADTRQIAMLMLACTVQGLALKEARTFDVKWLREHFGMQSPYYDEWRHTFTKLKELAAAVTASTSFSVSLHPVRDKQDKRRVVGVRIDSKKKSRLPLPLQHRREKLREVEPWPLVEDDY